MPIEETIDEARRHPASLPRGSSGPVVASTREYITSQNVYDDFRLESALRDVPVANNYVDRPHDIEDLEKVLLPTNEGSLRRRVFVLYGLGGIGKTQLASVYIRRHQARYSSILWLDGRSEDAVRRSLAAYARFIPAGQIPEGCRTSPMTTEDANSAIENVLGWLAIAQNTGWIIVFDNVDQDYDGRHETGAFDIQKYIPGEHGAVLITTRLSQLGRQVGGVFKELKKADNYLAQSIFEGWLGRELKEEGNQPAVELLTLLDGLPLALAQAGSFLHETGIDIPTYVCFYKEQWDDLMGNDQSGLLHDHGQRSIATTWEISLRDIQARNTNAANLVRLWGFADKNDISHDILQAAATENEVWPSWLHDLARNKLKFLQAIQLLLRYSMVQHTQAAQGCYSMHPVVQRWTVYMQVESERKTFLRLALILIGTLVPSSYSRDYWLLQQRLLPHADRCAWGLGETRDLKEIIESVTAAKSIHWLGILYADQGRREEAEAMYNRALEGREKALGTDHTSTLSTINNLGTLYADQGRREEAEAMYNRALEGREKALGPDHISTLDIVNNLGLLYKDQGRREEAETMCNRALEGYKKALGPDHISTLDTVNNLGSLYTEQGRREEAEVMFERGRKAT